MGALSRILSNTNFRDEVRVSVLGSASAGKTTLVRYLETGEIQTEPPSVTLGLDYRENGFKIADIEFKLIDVGGQSVYQDVFWDVAVQQSEAVVYVFDSTIRPELDSEKFEIVKEQFYYANEVINKNTVLLILLNKSDLKELNPISPMEFSKLYNLRKIKTNKISFVAGSAKFGDGIEKAFTWFSEELKKSKNKG